MHLRNVNIVASSEDNARARGALELNTTASNVAVKEVGSGEYEASLINADADLAIEVSKDHMAAVIEKYFPPRGTGEPLTPERVNQSLTAAGVVYGVDKTAIDELIKLVEAGEIIQNFPIAKGKKPTPPSARKIIIKGNPKYPAFPGLLLAKEEPPTEGIPGRTVGGEEVPIPEKNEDQRDERLLAGDNTHLTSDEENIYADTYGLVTIDRGKFSIKPAYDVEANLLTAKCDIYRLDFSETQITHQRLRDMFNDLGISFGFDRDVCDEALEKLEKNKDYAKDSAKAPCVRSVALFCGEPPKDGIDAKLEILYEDDDKDKQKSARMAQKHIDHRERNSFHSVGMGRSLAKIIPATRGVPGKNIKGQTLEAKDGEEATIECGANVEFRQSDLTFIATLDGIVVHHSNKISVSEVLEIKGDVDYETGNIRLEKGAVHVFGNIRTGFTVEASGDITVDDSIEGANIRSGKNIEVHRGIVMNEQGHIHAVENISAHFAENAIITCEGNISIDNDLTNSRVVCKGNIDATKGKGVIMGGSIQVAGNVYANEIGSDMGVPTYIIIGIKPEGLIEAEEEKRNIIGSLAKIQEVIGTDTPQDILKRTPPVKRKAVAEIIKAGMGLKQRIAEIDEEIQHMKEQQEASKNGEVRVIKRINPGAHITIGGQHYMVKSPVSRARFHFDIPTNEVKLTPLE